MRSGASLDAAAGESARVLTAAVAGGATESGLLTALDSFQTVDALVRRLGFHHAKRHTTQTILDIMVQHGLVERSPSGTHYRRKEDRQSDGQPLGFRTDITDAWLPRRHEVTIASSQRAFLGRDLDFLRSADDWYGFDHSTAASWQVNLTNPLYEFGRLFAVHAIAGRGRTYLDLASGLGIGAHRLAEWSDWDCDITCVEKSADFNNLARRLVVPSTTKIRFINRDLNDGLPPVRPQSIDGVLFIGAFHYIRDKRRMLHEIYSALRPGGRLVVGHCAARSGRPDELANDYMFSITSENAWVVGLNELLRLFEEAGFERVDELHRGSQFSAVLERPAHRRLDAAGRESVA